ncbi:MAG: hypothetical protein GF400_11630 [Candidatus Eisenbacteria bacterium]|nr:hypothetical protein [Candidatus Eisenbacteria bacterium]
MICAECGEREAAITYTEVRDGELCALRLCEECARRRGVGEGLSSFAGPLVSILMGLLEESLAPARAGGGRSADCPQCGLSYSEFRRSGRLGCPACYESFEGELEPLLRRVHGATTHVGEHPPELCGAASRRRELAGLRSELARAVEREEYERAAELRDEIRAREEASDVLD